MGVLGWPPEVFWRAVLPDLVHALDGWMLARGMKGGDTTQPLGRDEMNKLIEKLG